MSKTILLINKFEEDFEFSKEQLILIEETSKRTRLTKEVIKDFLFYFFRSLYIELLLNNEKVNIKFPFININNFKLKKDYE